VTSCELNFPTQCQLSEEIIASLVDSSNLRLTLARFLEMYFNEKRKVFFSLRFIPVKENYFFIAKSAQETKKHFSIHT